MSDEIAKALRHLIPRFERACIHAGNSPDIAHQATEEARAALTAYDKAQASPAGDGGERRTVITRVGLPEVEAIWTHSTASPAGGVEKVLTELDALHAKATLGPWRMGNTGPEQRMIVGGDERSSYVASVQIHQTPRAMGAYAEPEREANAGFILALANAYPALRQHIAALTKRAVTLSAENATLRKLLAKVRREAALDWNLIYKVDAALQEKPDAK